MNLIKTTTTATVLLATLAGAQVSTAAVSGNVALTSNYIWRGTTQNQEDPAIQGGFDFESESGFSAGVWGSSVDFGGDESTEIDIYGGYGIDIGELNLNAGFVAYKYFGGETASGDFEEISVGAGYAGLGLTYSKGLDDADDNIELSYGIDLKGVSLALAYGDYDSYSYYSAGISGEVAGLGWDLTVADTDADDSETQVALTFSKSL